MGFPTECDDRVVLRLERHMVGSGVVQRWLCGTQRLPENTALVENNNRTYHLYPSALLLVAWLWQWLKKRHLRQLLKSS